MMKLLRKRTSNDEKILAKCPKCKGAGRVMLIASSEYLYRDYSRWIRCNICWGIGFGWVLKSKLKELQIDDN